MHHYFEAITNRSGDSMVGYFVRVINPTTLATVDIYSDNSGTPIFTVSGVENMAKTDENGNVSLYVEPGTYNVDIYQPDATTFIMRVPNVAMNSTKGDKGDKGDTGPVGLAANTFESVAALKATDISLFKTASLTADAGGAQGSFFWTPGNFTGQADNLNIIKADSTALSVGAWVRQGADKVAVAAETPTAIIRPLIESVREIPLTAKMFGAVGDGVANDTARLQAMLDYAKTSKREVRESRSGKYLVDATLSIDRELRWLGAGAGGGRGTEIISVIADPNAPVISLDIPSGQSAITADIGNFSITSPGSFNDGYARGGVGMRINTAPGHIVADSRFHDIVINNHSVGIEIGGVVYQCDFERIRVSGDSALTGVPLGPDIAGFDLGNRLPFLDITYNTFSTCEVTNVRNGGYAWRGGSSFTNWTNCTADGPVFLASVGGTVINFTVEGWTQDIGASPVSSAMFFDRFASVIGPTTRAIPAGKVAIALQIQGTGCTIIGLKNFDGILPVVPIHNEGVNTYIGCNPEGTVVNKIPETGAGGLNGSLAINCEAVTDHGFAYRSATNWTPDFSSWSTPPTVFAASYTIEGNTVTVFINATGGVHEAGDTIGGLPFGIASVGSVGHLAAGDGSKNYSARIQANDDNISGLPARDLTGEFWQFTGTYRRA